MVRLLSRMRPKVLREIAARREALLTLRARIRPLASMNSHVNIEVAISCELLPADLAFEWHFCGAHSGGLA